MMELSIEQVISTGEKDDETVLSAEDFARVPKVEIDLKTLGIATKSDPTMGNHTEGDILMLSANSFYDYNSRPSRSSLFQMYRRWPKAQIPYAISTRYGPYARSVIAKAMRMYHDQTCIRFIPRDPVQHRDYLFFVPDDGCYSLVGRIGGRQLLSLDSGCIQSGTIVHELMHTLGFFHEQSRPDRDDYIKILWDNVMSGAEDQFEKYSRNIIGQLNEPYDYSSIMHYGPYAFSGNGMRTIVALKDGAEDMGQRHTFSAIDLDKINKLYSCPVADEDADSDGDYDKNANTIRTTQAMKPIKVRLLSRKLLRNGHRLVTVTLNKQAIKKMRSPTNHYRINWIRE